jgi:hypothetical protein
LGVHWVHVIWFHYEWPSDLGNGPESLTELIVGAVGVSLLWPPIRKRVSAFLSRHLAAEHAELHRKLDHIIEHHPDIPALPPKEESA